METVAGIAEDFDPGGRRWDLVLLCQIDHPYYLTRPTAAAFFALAGYTIVAERLTDDGHRGFVLAPGPCAEPDWPALEDAAAQFLAAVTALQTG